MVFWWEGSPYPFDVLPGDVLFIAGCLPVDSGKSLWFEHVVIAGERRSVATADEFLKLRIYGMPESDPDITGGGTIGTGICQHTAEYWLTFRWLGEYMGSKFTVWNLGCRDTDLDVTDVEFLLPIIEGAFRCRYEPTFRVDPTLATETRTNCLGFVCSVLEYLGVKHLHEDFPAYPHPFTFHETETRSFPSPGHLAHVLNASLKPLPWRPRDDAEAAAHSRVVVTLDEVVRGAVGPCSI